MTIRRQIIDLFEAQPNLQLHQAELVRQIEGNPKRVKGIIAELVSTGILTKVQQPGYRNRILVLKSRTSILEGSPNLRSEKLGDSPKPSPKPSPKMGSGLHDLIYINNIILKIKSYENIIREKNTLCHFLGAPKISRAKAEILTELNKLLETLPDEQLLAALDLLVRNLRRPVLPTTRETFPTISEEMPPITPVAPPPSSTPSEGVTTSERILEKARQRLKSTEPKRKKVKNPHSGSFPDTKLEGKEVTADQHKHIRYWGLKPLQRDFEFACAYLKVLEKNQPAVAGRYSAHLSGVLALKKNKHHPHYTKARITADIRGAKYEDYCWAIFLWYDRKFEGSAAARWPQPKDLYSENARDCWSSYLSEALSNDLMITRGDLEAMEDPRFLPENFDADKTNSELYRFQCGFIQDRIFGEVERWDRESKDRTPFHDKVQRAIDKRILSRAWVEGFGVHHDLKNLELFRFKEETFLRRLSCA